MAVSRWERGLHAPGAEFYLALGSMAGGGDRRSFWQRAGLQMADVEHALRDEHPPLSTLAETTPRASVVHGKTIVEVPLLNTTVATHGEQGDSSLSLEDISASQMMGAPAEWVPNPQFTRLVHVKGSSMAPLIHDRDFAAVDLSQDDLSQLNGKVVLVSGDEQGLFISCFRDLAGVEVLESANHEYAPVVLHKKKKWRVVGRVLWWISAAP